MKCQRPMQEGSLFPYFKCLIVRFFEMCVLFKIHVFAYLDKFSCLFLLRVNVHAHLNVEIGRLSMFHVCLCHTFMFVYLHFGQLSCLFVNLYSVEISRNYSTVS